MAYYFVVVGAFTGAVLLWIIRLHSMLAERKEATRAALESTEDGVLVLNSRRKILAYNGKFTEMWRIPEEVMKTNDDGALFRYVLPQLLDPEAELARYRRLYANASAPTSDHMHLKDGRIFERHLQPQFLRKRLVGWAWGFRDITARRELEKAAEGERQLLHHLMDNLLENIYFKDAEGRFTRVNQAQARFLGLSDPEAVVGKTDFDYFSAGHAQAAYADEQELLSGRQACVSKEEKTIRPDKGETWVLTTKLPLRDGNGSIVGTFGISRDISARKEVENRLREAKQAAETANRLKSEFLANVSHEIRTPMNGILGCTGFALGTELTEEQRDYIETVQTCAESLHAILNDILDFSRIEADTLQLECSEFSPAAVVQSATKVLQLDARRKNLQTHWQIDSLVPPIVTGDPARLRQILLNLLGNAIKFTNNGYVAVFVRVAAQETDSVTLQFSVVDSGVGIPEDKRQAIFEPFRQADGSLTRKYGGTGLGLAISLKLVQMLRGQLEVNSREGRGSTFRFTAVFGNASPHCDRLTPAAAAASQRA